MLTTKTLPRATPSTGTPNNGDWKAGVVSRDAALVREDRPARVFDTPNPQGVTLCGEPWDRLSVSPHGPVCEGCAAEYRKRHPTWPLPGGAA